MYICILACVCLCIKSIFLLMEVGCVRYGDSGEYYQRKVSNDPVNLI